MMSQCTVATVQARFMSLIPGQPDGGDHSTSKAPTASPTQPSRCQWWN